MRASVFVLFLSAVIVNPSHAIRKNWRDSLAGFVTRCFETKDVLAYCDNLGPDGERVVREELQIEAKDFSGKSFSYIYGKGIEGNLCKEHLGRIKRLMRRTNQVCVSGDQEFHLDNGEIVSTWRGLETKRGEVTW